MTWNKLAQHIKENTTFCITSHISQDADNIGAQTALYWLISSCFNKEVHLYNTDEVPRKFSFIKNTDKISAHPPKGAVDTLIVLDSSNLSRIGWEDAEKYYSNCINIDHHRDNSNFGTLNIVDPHAAATCQIIARLFAEGNINYPSFVADALYAGILADTGGFQFENTTGELLRDAAALIDNGARNVAVYKKLFSSHSIQAMKLRAEIWSTLEFFEDGRIAVMSMDAQRISELGADRGDTEGMADVAKNAEGVRVSMLIKKKDSSIHFSFRSDGSVDVGAIAAGVPGGGGHSSAAGCDLRNISLDQAKHRMLGRIKEVL
jgi:phosphoesterase RecJ-like protein